MESRRGRPAVGAPAGQFADEQDAGQLAVGVRGELPVGAPGEVPGQRGRPDALRTAAVFWAERPTTITRAPRPATCRAAAAPMPSLAPVITTVRPSSGAALAAGPVTVSSAPSAQSVPHA
jgi:hypothetical protein